MADCFSHSPAMEGLHVVGDTIVHPVLAEWLSDMAPHLDLDGCVFSSVATLHASRLALTLCCLQYSMLHLCRGQLATQKHTNHTYTHCPIVFA